MRLLADENIPGAVVAALTGAGHDVVWIRQTTPGASDPAVLEIPREGGRILLSFDKDFGELVFKRRLPAPPGLILLRFTPASPTEAAEFVVAMLQRQID